MPRIPIIAGQGGAVVVQPSSTIPVTGYQGLAELGSLTGDFGAKLQQIGEKLQAHQNELDTLTLIGDFNGKVKELQYDIRQDVADPLQRSKEFEKRAKQSQDELVATTKNPNVAREFTQYANRHLPVHTGQVHLDAMKWMGEQQTAQMRDVSDLISKNAYLAESPQDRDSWIQAYTGVQVSPGVWKGGIITSNPHLDPEEKQKERKKFAEKSQREFMDHLAKTNLDRLLELEDQKAFQDVDQKTKDLILDRAQNKRAADLRRTDAELEKITKVARENTEIEADELIRTGKMSEGWINERKALMAGAPNGAEKIKSWHTSIRNNELGILTGDPETERRMGIDVYNEKLNPQTTIDRLTRLYNDRKIGEDKRKEWMPHLQSVIARKAGEAKALEDAGEAKVNTIKRRRADTVLETAALALKVTGILDIDKEATDALTEFRQIFTQEEFTHGGTKDATEVYKEHMPDAIAKTQSRLETRRMSLEDSLGSYKSKDQLVADKGKMSAAEYDKKLGQIFELYAIKNAVIQLEANRKAIGRAAPPKKR